MLHVHVGVVRLWWWRRLRLVDVEMPFAREPGRRVSGLGVRRVVCCFLSGTPTGPLRPCEPSPPPTTTSHNIPPSTTTFLEAGRLASVLRRRLCAAQCRQLLLLLRKVV